MTDCRCTSARNDAFDLTEDIGNEHLARHLAAVIALMKAAPNKGQFERMFARAFPDRVQQLELAMSDPEDEDDI